MIPMSHCSICVEIPPVKIETIGLDEKGRRIKIMGSGLLDLDIDIRGSGHFFRCGACSTYYRVESDFFGSPGSINIRMVRVTLPEARAAMESDWIDRGETAGELCIIDSAMNGIVPDMEEMLECGIPSAIFFAAQTLADCYKTGKDRKALSRLLKHRESDVRLGAAWTFAELPWHSWNVDTPGVDFMATSLFRFRPYMKVESVMREILGLLNDSDVRIRRLIRGFVLGVMFPLRGERLLMRLSRIPKPWSSELKQVRIENLYPGGNDAAQTELVGYLGDDAEEVIIAAINRFYDYCSMQNTERLKFAIRSVYHESPNDITDRFLNNPEPWRNDDDDPFD